MATDNDQYESYMESHISDKQGKYKCTECGVDVPAPTWKANDGLCRDCVHGGLHGIGYFAKGGKKATN